MRGRILDVASDLLAAEGVAAVTTRRVAALAHTSPPAIYELFGHKAGLVRELFFEGFRRLGDVLDAVAVTADPVDDLTSTVLAFREFTLANPHLFQVMYSQPFDVHSPRPHERTLGDRTRMLLIDRVVRCIDGGRLVGDPTDVAHALLGLAIGLATQDVGGWLGSTEASRSRRWDLAVTAMIEGLAAPTVRA
jgi:AcrR family transcriptional regulator